MISSDILYMLRQFANGFSLEFEQSESPTLYRIHLSIQVNLNDALVWMVSTGPFFPKSSKPFINPLVTAQNTLLTICIAVIFLFHNYF